MLTPKLCNTFHFGAQFEIEHGIQFCRIDKTDVKKSIETFCEIN